MTGARSLCLTASLLGFASCAIAQAQAEPPQQVQQDKTPIPPSTPPFSQAREAPSPVPASPDGRAERIRSYRAIARTEADKLGLPPAIADAVIRVESNYNPAARGKDGEYGLMQVMPPTARLLGLEGPIETLAEPETNIRLGVKYLAGAWKLAKGDICTAAMKYRAGHGESRFSVLSVRYCVRVREHLASIGYPVTGSVPEPTFGFRADTTRMGIAIGTQQAAKRLASGKKLRSRSNWGAYDSKMKELDRRGRISLGL